MRTRALVLVVAGLGLVACPSHRRPSGPPPEYERPTVMPWDAAVPKDPLENVEGEWVTDEEPEDAGSGDTAAGDALSADAGLG